MIKKISLLFICILLSGCVNNGDISSQLDNVYDNQKIISNRTNNYTDYIEYFVPSDINEQEANHLSFSFDGDGFGFIMNINASNIINNEYYKDTSLIDEGFFDDERIVYRKDGSFNNIDGKLINYFSKVYQYSDNEYMLYFVTNELNFYGYSNGKRIGLLADKILQMAMTSTVNNEKILTDYSSLDVIDYEKKTVNLFENIFPVEGRVDDLMIDKTPKVSE